VICSIAYTAMPQPRTLPVATDAAVLKPPAKIRHSSHDAAKESNLPSRGLPALVLKVHHSETDSPTYGRDAVAAAA
jgi:hypothetical protein